VLDFSIEQSFAGSPDRVFRALADLGGAAEWMPGFVGFERLAGPSFDVGTAWRATRHLLGMEVTDRFEVTACDPPGHLEIRADGAVGSGEILFRYDIHPVESGARVTLYVRIADGMLGRMMAGPLRRTCVGDLESLADHLSRDA
jgi:carbon monoxide dehydrogenase subunit G